MKKSKFNTVRPSNEELNTKLIFITSAKMPLIPFKYEMVFYENGKKIFAGDVSEWSHNIFQPNYDKYMAIKGIEICYENIDIASLPENAVDIPDGILYVREA